MGMVNEPLTGLPPNPASHSRAPVPAAERNFVRLPVTFDVSGRDADSIDILGFQFAVPNFDARQAADRGR